MPTPTANVPSVDGECGRRIAERYRIVRKIGEGGMGCVYEAVHELLGRRVALKMLSGSRVRGEQAVSRFHREARAAAAIESPHVVEVFDYGTDEDDSPFLVMELLNGEDLARRLTREPQLGVARTIAIARQACEGLAAAHARGIVHRDIKPENLFLCERTGDAEHVKVLDFGIARIDRSADAPTVTTTGSITGTPRYLAPEQIEGLAVDGRADLYGLAVVIYRALAGFEPFRGPTQHMLLLRILADDPPSLRRVRPDVSDRLERVIFRALAKRPEDRYESAEAFAEALTLALPRAAADVGADGQPVVEPTLHIASARPERAPARKSPPYARRRFPKHAWMVAAPLALASLTAGFRVARATRAPSVRPGLVRRASAPPAPTSLLARFATPSVVSIELRILPACAHVTLDGQPIDNPSTIDRPRSSRPLALRASCAGYAPLETELVFDRDQRLVLALPDLPQTSIAASIAPVATRPRAETPRTSATSPSVEPTSSPSGEPRRDAIPETGDGFLDEF